MYRVLLRRNADGIERWAQEDLPWHEGFFWWTEGNFSCDCNRYLEFERAVGGDPDIDDAACGEGAYSAIKAQFPDGREIKLDDAD